MNLNEKWDIYHLENKFEIGKSNGNVKPNITYKTRLKYLIMSFHRKYNSLFKLVDNLMKLYKIYKNDKKAKKEKEHEDKALE